MATERALSLEDLARACGEPLERVREWHAAGLFAERPDGTFPPADVERALLIGVLERRGVARATIVKQIGDAFMLTFAAPRDAVRCALEIERLASAEPRFPAVRAGIHCGTVLYRDGDYVGANVNMAARLADAAERHQAVVSEAVRTEASPLDGVAFVSLARRRLKGISEDVELFVATPQETAAAVRVVDPVCGMELGPSESAARLTLAGAEPAFCSTSCLQRYVGDPTRYRPSSSPRTGGDP